MATLIIGSISDRSGKTAITSALATKFDFEDNPLSVGKLIFGGVTDASDVAVLTSLLPDKPQISGSPSEIASKVGGLAIVEGSSDATANLNLANDVDGLVILIATYGEDITTSAAEYGSRLAGVIINGLPKFRSNQVSKVLRDELQSEGIKLLGTVPDDRRMLAPKLGQVVDLLDGQFLSGTEESDRLLDNFLIGGLVLDWGPFYFASRNNTGVIVRGDRPDVQLAAIQTDTTQALVLTKGVRPVEYVIYEAAQRNIPIVVVPGSTHDVAEQLENLQPKVDFDHVRKLERMVELVSDHVDLEFIEDQLMKPATR